MKALVVDDEPKLAELLRDYLRAHGFEVVVASDGRAAVEAVRRERPDVVLLDVGLPVLDGLGACREIRAFSSVPILFVTARVDDVDRILGLELGADDYICKPYNPREVLARVNAVLRRVAAREAPEAAGPMLRRGRITIDPERLEVRLREGDGEAGRELKLELTAVEFRLLSALAHKPDRVFSRAQLMTRLYEDARTVTERTVDSHVKNVRKKAAALAPEFEAIIESIYGVGYRLGDLP